MRTDRDGAEKYLVVGNSAELPTLLPDLVGKVRLAVTSPPYHNAISYENHSADRDSDWRERSNIDYASEYLPLMTKVWDACFEMLAPGGLLAVNAGTVLESGYQYPLPQDLLTEAMRAGKWEYVRTVVWHKATAGVKRAGSVIQKRLPGYWYPNIMTEHIWVVRKPGAPAYQADDYPKAWDQPLWDVAPVPPRTVDHPAPFPEELPHRFTRMFTRPGDVVLDPFLGAGTTSKAAYDLGRVPAGVDLDPAYVTYAKERLARSSSVRPMQLDVQTVPAEEFVAKRTRSSGATRHGAGRATVKRKKESANE